MITVPVPDDIIAYATSVAARAVDDGRLIRFNEDSDSVFVGQVGESVVRRLLGLEDSPAWNRGKADGGHDVVYHGARIDVKTAKSGYQVRMDHYATLSDHQLGNHADALLFARYRPMVNELCVISIIGKQWFLEQACELKKGEVLYKMTCRNDCRVMKFGDMRMIDVVDDITWFCLTF